MTHWIKELENIKVLISKGQSLEQIGNKYNVSRQRMYQVFTKYGINTLVRDKGNYLKDKPPKYYWFNRMLCSKRLPKNERLDILSTINIPDVCPILGITLNYNGNNESGWVRDDLSPSIDRIDSSKGYVKDNIQVISWRANRIKNDSTPEELMKIALYMQNLTK